tara:strand:+ start:472 stop:888 length:417 start_codon:yes stop_codon:yes gene_type:complete
MKFDIKNRFTGDTQFTAEIKAGDETPTSVKIGLAVKWGIKNSADLRNADLRNANLQSAIGNMQHIKSIQIEGWPITYTADQIQIGCQRHPIEKWRGFSDRLIEKMDPKALEWWEKWKTNIFQIIEMSPAHPTGKEDKP